MGERAPVALLDAAASARLAIGRGDHQHRVGAHRAAVGHQAVGELDGGGRPPGRRRAPLRRRARRRRRARARARHRDPRRQGLAVDAHDVGRERGESRSVVAPLSLIVSAFAPVTDVRRALTPELRRGRRHDPELLLVDLGRGKNRLGGSALAQVYGAARRDAARPGRPGAAARLLRRRAGARRGGHRCSPTTIARDGGLFVTLLEMAFAGGAGLDIELGELGATIRSRRCSPRSWAPWSRCATTPTSRARWRCSRATASARARGGSGARQRDDRIILRRDGRTVFEERRSIAARHLVGDDPRHADAARRPDVRGRGAGGARRQRRSRPVRRRDVRHRRRRHGAAAVARAGARPRVAILREQGVNGQIEMAAAFDRAGFEAVDVHMTDLLGGRRDLADFRGLAACGGFSYGDVLGAGEGWAKSILFNPRARDLFAAFFDRKRHVRARRLQRLPDAVGAARRSSRAPAPGRASCATAASGSRRACRW